MCDVLQVSRSGYYTWLPSRDRLKKTHNQLKGAVLASWLDSGRVYGSRRVVKDLKEERGIFVSKSTVQPVMKVLGIRSSYQQKKFRKAYQRGEIASYPANALKRDFKLENPNQVWASDTTFIKSCKGWVYLCVIMDLFSKFIVGWSVGDKNNSDLVEEALQLALYSRGYPKGVLFHSDRGSEYSSYQIYKGLQQYHLTASMSRKGNCWDNAPVESFFKTLKVELINKINSKRLNLEEIKKECFNYIEGFYNTKRIHSSLDNKSPQMYEQTYSK